MIYVLCDIGGTQTRLALSEGDGLSTDPVIYATPKEYEIGLEQLKTHITNISRGRKIDVVAIGIAGSLDKDNRTLFNAPHLPDWNNKPLAADVSQAFDTKVFLENDTAMVALGEAVYGVGKDHDIVAYMTISTGIGGARVVNNRLDEHAYGFEPGHQIIMDPEALKGSQNAGQDSDSQNCPSCLMFGHLEGFVSGSAIEERYGKKPQDITDEHVWDEAARYLAYGLNNTIVYWSPHIIVLGGGLIMHDAIKIDKVKLYLENIMKIYPDLPVIDKGSLGDVGGLYGALAYIKNNIQS